MPATEKQTVYLKQYWNARGAQRFNFDMIPCELVSSEVRSETKIRSYPVLDESGEQTGEWEQRESTITTAFVTVRVKGRRKEVLANSIFEKVEGKFVPFNPAQ